MDRLEFKRLKHAVENSREDLEKFREVEAAALRQYCGHHYGDNASQEHLPLNMLVIAVETLLQQLAAKEPQVSVSTRNPSLAASAEEAALAINQQLLEMDFGAELQAFVMSALFSVGVMKVGIDTRYRLDDLKDTEIYAEHIPFANWVHDTTARKWAPEAVQFCGDKYRVPLEWAQNNDEYSKQARSRLTSDRPAFNTRQGESGSLAHDDSGSLKDESFIKMVDLWDIWIPSEQKLVTFAEDASRPLMERTIEHPHRGPYHLLGFNPVLNEIMPLPPVANWLDAHDLENKTLVKLGEQVSRQKTVVVVHPHGEADGKAMIEAKDGAVIKSANPAATKEVSTGGANQQTLAFAGWFRDLTDFGMGNLSSQAGLGPQADTLGQEKLIKGSGNARIQAMQGAVVKSLRQITRDIFWWMWNSPLAQYQLTQEIGGEQIAIGWPVDTDEFGREVDAREGADINLYDLDIIPHSLRDISPAERADMSMALFQQILMPGQQMGMWAVDGAEFLKDLARWTGLPRLEAYAQLTPDALPMGGDGGGMPNNTTREYIRRSVSDGPSRQGAERNMVTAMSSGPQGGEAV